MYLHLIYYCFRHFLASFLAFLMFLNSPLNLLRCSHMSFSLILFSSLFCFFKKGLLFSASLRFSLVNSLLYLGLPDIVKIVNVYWFLLMRICFFLNTFIVAWVFSHRSNLHFVSVGFKHYMKVAL